LKADPRSQWAVLESEPNIPLNLAKKIIIYLFKREAAKFWHEHNQKLIHNQTNNQNQQHLEHNYPFQRRIKRAEKSLNNNLKDDSKTLNELEILTKSLNSQQRKWMKAALNEIMKEGGGGGGEQNNEDNIQDNSMVLTVIERNQNK